MLRALWAAGVTPDLLVGGSVGAINACFVGSHPDAAGVEKLAASWLEVSEESLCGRRRGIVVNVARRRPYLLSSDRLRRLVSEWVPTYHLENSAIPVRVATTNIATGRPVHHDHGYIPDLLAASAASRDLSAGRARGPDGPVTHVDAGVSENVPLSGAGPGEAGRPDLGAGRRGPRRRGPAQPPRRAHASSPPRCATATEPTFHPTPRWCAAGSPRASTAGRCSTSPRPPSPTSSVRGGCRDRPRSSLLTVSISVPVTVRVAAVELVA